MSKEFDEMTPEEKAAKNLRAIKGNLTNGPMALSCLQRELNFTRALLVDDQDMADLYIQLAVELMMSAHIEPRKIKAALRRAIREMHA